MGAGEHEEGAASLAIVMAHDGSIARFVVSDPETGDPIVEFDLSPDRLRGLIRAAQDALAMLEEPSTAERFKIADAIGEDRCELVVKPDAGAAS